MRSIRALASVVLFLVVAGPAAAQNWVTIDLPTRRMFPPETTPIRAFNSAPPWVLGWPSEPFGWFPPEADCRHSRSTGRTYSTGPTALQNVKGISFLGSFFRSPGGAGVTDGDEFGAFFHTDYCYFDNWEYGFRLALDAPNEPRLVFYACRCNNPGERNALVRVFHPLVSA